MDSRISLGQCDAFEANCDGRELLSPLDVEQALMDCGFDLDDELDVMLQPLRDHDAELALHEFDYLVAQLEDWVTERPLYGHQFYTTAYHRVPYHERAFECY